MREKTMLRVSLFLLLGFIFFVPAAPAEADWHSFWQRSHKDCLRNNCWPMPFQKADRESVCQALSVQLAKGWKRQNTLSEVYFNSETQSLNEAGRRKLFAIVQATPEEYRKIYVVRSMNTEATEARLASIQEASNQLFADQTAPEIVSVGIAPRSWSAAYINNITTKEAASIPQPRLPDFEDTTASN